MGTPIPTPTPQPCGIPDCRWNEYVGNPVYNPTTTRAYYQTVRYDRSEFAPFGPSAFYKMWYDYASAGGIALATSPDGINWTFQTNMTGLVPTARHSRVLFDRTGFGMGTPYRIWYWDLTYLYVDSPTVLRMLRTASSVDGINWTGDTTLFQNPAAPLLVTTPGAPNLGSYGPADVHYYPDNPSVIDLVNPFNNRYVMYYCATDGSMEQIALAVSTDGITWSQVGPMPVLPKGGPGAWDSNYATEHAVVLRLAPDRFVMWYSGGTTASDEGSGVLVSSEGIGCATSTDGLNWTKFAGNPIFSIFDGVEWRSGRTHNPWVLFDPNRFDGHGDRVCYKFWMTGAPAVNPSDINIGYATNPIG